MIACKLTLKTAQGLRIYHGLYRSTCDAILSAQQLYGIKCKIKAEKA